MPDETQVAHLPCIQKKAAKDYVSYKEVYDDYLSLTSDYVKSTHPNVTDDQFVIYNYVTAEGTESLSPEEKAIYEEAVKLLKNEPEDTKSVAYTSSLSEESKTKLKEYIEEVMDKAREDILNYMKTLV